MMKILQKNVKKKNNVYSEEMKIVFFTMPLYYVEEAKSIIEEISKSLKSYNKNFILKCIRMKIIRITSLKIVNL